MTQLVDPRDRRPAHKVLPAHLNATTPVGIRPDDLTVANSLTPAPTQAEEGLAETMVAETCFLTCGAAVDALAGSAHRAQVAVATAVTDPVPAAAAVPG